MDYTLGEIIMFAGDYAPQDFLACNGQAVSKTDYAPLYALLGGTYGESGNSFNLPNLTGRIPIGTGQGAGGLTPRTLGQTGGSATVTLTQAQIPAHTHQVMASTQIGTSSSLSGNLLAATPAEIDPYVDVTKPLVPPPHVLTAGVIAPAGSSQPHLNVMQTAGIGFYICVQGIYPGTN